jgi:DNA invertase Pin-like site-specific DNA recombinase
VVVDAQREVTMQRYPIAYLRRSSADANNPGDVSREAQEAAIRELARRDGYAGEVRVLADWDRSADEAKESRRAGFLAMLAAIDRGEVSVVYAASLDRLYRSMRTFVRLTDAAKAHDTRIVTLREGVLGGDGSPMAQAFAEITAVFSGLELRTTKARAAGALAVRRSRGDHIGRAGYGTKLARNEAGAIVLVPDPARPLEPVLAAVKEAGSILGACKLLNARGVPVPQGPTATRPHDRIAWYPTPLRKIVERNAPGLLPPSGPSGRRTPAHSMFAQLLVCHCGHILTPEPGRRSYRCTVGNRNGREAHGPMFASEARLMPWIQAEAARLRVIDSATGESVDAVRLAADHAAERAALAGRLERANELFVLGPKAGGWTRERRDAEAAAVAAEVDRLGAAEAVVTIPAIDWTWPPERINTVLRALWQRVELDERMHPVEAFWRVPEWRA